MEDQNPQKKNILFRGRKIIASVLLFTFLGLSFGFYPWKVKAQEAVWIMGGEHDVNVIEDPLSTKVDRGESLPTANAFEDIILGPIKSFGQMLQNFNYGEVLNLVLRRALTKIIDRFYKKVIEKFEEAYRIKDTYAHSWLPHINNAFAKFHQWVSEQVGGGMQAPFLEAFMGLENLFYKRTVALGYGLEAWIIKKFVKGVEMGGATTPDSAGDALGTPQFWTRMVESIYNDGLTLTIKGAAKLQEEKTDAEIEANLRDLNAGGLSKGQKIMDLPEGGWLKPLEVYHVTAGANLNRDEVIAKLNAWGYTEVAGKGDLTSASGGKPGTYRWDDYDAANKTLHIWSWHDDYPVGIIHSGAPPPPPPIIGMIMQYDPGSGRNISNVLNYGFTSRPSYDPAASGWTGWLQRPGQRVAQYLKDLVNLRLGRANDESGDLKGLGKVMYQMMDVFMDKAIEFDVEFATDPNHPMYGCPIGFKASVGDLWKEMKPFHGKEQPSELDCLLKAIDTYAFDLIPRFLKFISCTAKKLICWVFNVNPKKLPKEGGRDDTRVGDDQTHQYYERESEDSGADTVEDKAVWGGDRVVSNDANYNPIIKDPSPWNDTEVFLQHVAMYFVYTKVIKPHLPAVLKPSTWLERVFGAIFNLITDILGKEIEETFKDAFDFVKSLGGEIWEFAKDILDSVIWGKVIRWLLDTLGFCGLCEEEKPFQSHTGPPGPGPVLTCEEQCLLPENQDSIFYTGRYKVIYYAPQETDMWLNITGGQLVVVDEVMNGPLLPMHINHLKFEACNCTVDGQGQSTYDGLIGWHLRFADHSGSGGINQGQFESSLTETQRVQILNNSTCVIPQYGCNMPTGNARGQNSWPKMTAAYIPFGTASGESKRGIGVRVNRFAVPRNVHFTLETKKVSPGAATDYRQNFDFVIPIAVNTFFDLVLGMNDTAETFGPDEDLPEPILRKLTQPTKVVDYLEEGNEYELELFLLNKTGKNYAMSNDFIQGIFDLAPIGPDTQDAAECIEILSPGKLRWNDFGQAIATNWGAEFQLALWKMGYSYADYERAQAWAAGNYADNDARAAQSGPERAVPIFDESADASEMVLRAMGLSPGTGSIYDPVEPTGFFAGGFAGAIENRVFNDFTDNYQVLDMNGNPITAGQVAGYIWKGVKFVGAYKNPWLLPAKRWFEGKGRSSKPIPSAAVTQQWEFIKGSTLGVTEDQNAKDVSEKDSPSGSPLIQDPRVLAYDAQDGLIQKNREKFRFRVRPGCDGKIVPFALYIVENEKNYPISTLPFFWQVGLPTEWTPGGAEENPFAFVECGIRDDDNNDDIAQPGEEIELRVYLRNDGSINYTSEVFLTSLTPGITLVDDDANFNIDNGEHDHNEYKFDIPAGYAGNSIKFHLQGTITGTSTSSIDEDFEFYLYQDGEDDGLGGNNACSEGTPVPEYADLQIANLNVDWDWYNEAGERRGEIRKGEAIDLVFKVTNNGSVEANAGWDFDLTVRYPGKVNQNEKFGAITITEDLAPGETLTLDRNVDSDLNNFEIYYGPEDYVSKVCFGVYLDAQGGGGNQGVMTMGEVPEGVDLNSAGERNNRIGYHNGTNQSVFCIPIEEEPTVSDKDLEISKLQINRLRVSQGSLIVEYAYRNNATSMGIPRDELNHDLWLHVLREDPGVRDPVTGCYENVGRPFHADLGDNLTLDPGEERPKLFSNQNINIQPGESYQVRMEFLDNDLISGPERDINLDNNVLCTEPQTPVAMGPSLPQESKQSAVAIQTQNQPAASAYTPSTPLSWKQRLGRVWGYVRKIFPW